MSIHITVPRSGVQPHAHRRPHAPRPHDPPRDQPRPGRPGGRGATARSRQCHRPLRRPARLHRLRGGPPAKSEYSAGMGFYSAVWSLVDRPLADFQIGLAGCWITPDNSDNKDKPLAPEGTLARKWKERGPTWDSVFQTVEGGLGYWAGNHFRYGPPKFSINATPQCYDYEVGSPGWSFFYSNEALPDHRLGIAQLSNRLRRLQGLARRRPGLLRALRREGRVAVHADDEDHALQAGREADDRRGARPRHANLRGERLGPGAGLCPHRHAPGLGALRDGCVRLISPARCSRGSSGRRGRAGPGRRRARDGSRRRGR